MYLTTYYSSELRTLESGIDLGQGINIGPGIFFKTNDVELGKIFKKNIQNGQTYVKNKIKHENFRSPWEIFQKFINVGP